MSLPYDMFAQKGTDIERYDELAMRSALSKDEHFRFASGLIVPRVRFTMQLSIVTSLPAIRAVFESAQCTMKSFILGKPASNTISAKICSKRQKFKLSTPSSGQQSLALVQVAVSISRKEVDVIIWPVSFRYLRTR